MNSVDILPTVGSTYLVLNNTVMNFCIHSTYTYVTITFLLKFSSKNCSSFYNQHKFHTILEFTWDKFR